MRSETERAIALNEMILGESARCRDRLRESAATSRHLLAEFRASCRGLAAELRRVADVVGAIRATLDEWPAHETSAAHPGG